MIGLERLGTLPLAFAQAPVTVVESGGLPYWVEMATSVATIIIALALVVVALALIAVALGARALIRRLQQIAERAQEGTQPILRHAEDVAENVSFIAASVRDDVEHFKGTLHTAQQRLDRAAALAEQRINQFNALLEVVQEEAEELFIDTASTLRGVRAGAESLQRSSPDREWEADAEDGMELERPPFPPRRP